jgi:tetratricopeptide (TPR) repeat protein
MTYMKIHVLRLFMALFLLFAYSAKGSPYLDSLWQIWNDPKAEAEDQMAAMRLISWQGYMGSKPDSAYILGQLLYDYAEEKGVERFMSTGLSLQGLALTTLGDYRQAIKAHEKSLIIIRKLENKQSELYAYGNLGINYKHLGNYQKAAEYHIESLKIAEEIADTVGLLRANINIGNMYLLLQEYARAVTYYESALLIGELSNDIEGIAMSNGNIGDIYNSLGEFEKAIKYTRIAIELHAGRNDLQSLSIVYAAMGSSYRGLGRLDSAIIFYKIAWDLAEEISDNSGIANALNNIAQLLHEKGRTQEAIAHFQQALGIAEALNLVAEISGATMGLYNIYKEANQHEEALNMFEIHDAIEDSLASEKHSTTLIRKEAEYEFEKQIVADSVAQAYKEAELAAIEAQKAEKHLRANRIQFSGIIVIVLLLALIIAFSGRISMTRRMADGLVFIFFILLFELGLVIMDPYVDDWSEGQVGIKLAVNTVFALIVFFGHQFFEKRLISVLPISKQK